MPAADAVKFHALSQERSRRAGPRPDVPLLLAEAFSLVDLVAGYIPQGSWFPQLINSGRKT